MDALVESPACTFKQAACALEIMSTQAKDTDIVEQPAHTSLLQSIDAPPKLVNDHAQASPIAQVSGVDKPTKPIPLFTATPKKASMYDKLTQLISKVETRTGKKAGEVVQQEAEEKEIDSGDSSDDEFIGPAPKVAESSDSDSSDSERIANNFRLRRGGLLNQSGSKISNPRIGQKALILPNQLVNSSADLPSPDKPKADDVSSTEVTTDTSKSEAAVAVIDTNTAIRENNNTNDNAPSLEAKQSPTKDEKSATVADTKGAGLLSSMLANSSFPSKTLNSELSTQPVAIDLTNDADSDNKTMVVDDKPIDSLKEQHRVLQQFEKPGPPDKKKKSAFVDDSLDEYLQKYESTADVQQKPAKSRSATVSDSRPDTPTEVHTAHPQSCHTTKRLSLPGNSLTSAEEMNYVEIDGYKFYMFESKKDMKGHVLSTTMSKLASSKRAFEKSHDAPKPRGWRRKFGSRERIPVLHPGIRHKWLSSRRQIHGLEKHVFDKLGFRLEPEAEDEVSISLLPTVRQPKDKYTHMKKKKHRLANTQTVTFPLVYKLINTLAVAHHASGCIRVHNIMKPTSILGGKYGPVADIPVKKEAVCQESNIEQGAVADVSVTREVVCQQSNTKSRPEPLNDSFEMELEPVSDVQYDYDDTKEPMTRVLPAVVRSPTQRACSKPTCRLGCICRSLQISNWKRVIEKHHCGDAACMFGCTCSNWKR